MEPLQQDDPRRIGAYTTLARLRESASAVHYLASGAASGSGSDSPAGSDSRSGSGDTAVVVSAARPELAAVPAFRRRFAAEARTAERLAGGWVPEPLAMATATDGQELWTASAYVPALTLREAIALTGPLPERTVRILGAGLAETLSRVHATGTVLHGLAPDTVLLTADGPRLAAYGALGAAAVAQARPGGQLSVQLGYLTPEQATGAEPGPASDIFVLGLLLAYAATGTAPLADAAGIAHGEPELGAVPDELRPLTARCLSKSPEDRPTAGTVAADLALEGAAALARGGWLPQPLSAALAAQAAQADALRSGGAGATGGTQHGPLGSGGPENSGTLPTASLVPAPGRTSPGPGTAAGPFVADDAPPAGPVSGNAPAYGAAGQDAHPHGNSAGHPTTTDTTASAHTAPGPAAPGQAHPTGAARAPFPAQGRNALPAAPAAGGHGFGGAAGGVTDPATLVVRRAAGPPSVPPAPPSLPGGVPGVLPPSRRGLLVAVAAGVSGLVVGGGGVYAVAGGDDKAAPAPQPPAHRRTRMAGLAPEPAWRYEHPEEPAGATVWRDRVLLLTDGKQATGVDLRTGRRLWAMPEAASGSRAVPVDDRLCLVQAGDELLWIAAQDGKVAHKVAERTFAEPGESLAVEGVIGADGTSVWLTGHVSRTVERKVKKRKKKVTVREAYVIAYDAAARKQLWRARVPEGKAPHRPRYELVAARADSILVRQDGRSLTPAQSKRAKGGSVLLGFDRATGKALKSVTLTGVGPTAAVAGDTGGKLFGAAGGELHAYDSGNGKRLWRVPAAKTPGEKGVFAYGTATVRGPALYAANRYQEVRAVDVATGRALWSRSTETPAWREIPQTTLSLSGRTVFAGDAVALTAFAARDGRRLWKFQEAGTRDAENPQAAPRYVPLAGGEDRIVVRRGRTFYSLPVD
ncbi:PQQ-binding-like beta-propeller repeat protein [Streptomyces sp. NBC_00390]|uniref:outer membrane protein assembly factor BamB family protein n=1 Tax=Streptomyces sp. NBC_00390 TaxID=2975736 RepID=UPI002E1ACBC2